MKPMQSMCKLLYAVFDLSTLMTRNRKSIKMHLSTLTTYINRSKTAYNSLHIYCIDFISWVSTGCIAMYSTVHWFHVESVDRCIRFSILINTVHSNAMSWVSTGCIAMYSTVHWFHVVSVESIYFFLRFTLCFLIQSLWFTFWLITSLIIVRFWCSLHHWKALDLLFQNITSICIWYNVVSVDRLHCYVQYSTLVSCRECRQMHIDVIFWKRRSRAFQWCKLHQNRTIIKEVTSQNVHSNAMSSVSKDAF